MSPIVLLTAISCFWVNVAFAKVYDLSHEFNNDTIYWPTGTPFRFFIAHRGPSDPTQEATEDNFWYEANDISTAEHCGTHLDAPVHFARNHWSVDQIPPEHFFGPVSVVDLRHVVKDDADYQITAEDLIQWESINGKQLDPLIILWTGWGSRWPDRETYLGSTSLNDFTVLRFPGLSRNAAQWLADNRLIHGIGIDTASIDYGRSKLFHSHRILAKKDVFNIENVNTKVLDENVVKNGEPLFLMVTPLKISTGSGSPVRPILISGTHLTNLMGKSNTNDNHRIKTDL